MKTILCARSNSVRMGWQMFGVLAMVGFAPSIVLSQGPIPAPITKGSIRIELDEIASNLTSPISMTHANDGSGRTFVADQAGDITLLKNDVPRSEEHNV